MKPQSITVGKTQIRILPTVKGLGSESEIVEAEINSFKPDLVVLSIGPEEVKGTREWAVSYTHLTLPTKRIV